MPGPALNTDRESNVAKSRRDALSAAGALRRGTARAQGFAFRILLLLLCVILLGIEGIRPGTAGHVQTFPQDWAEYDRLMASAPARMLANPKEALAIAQRLAAIAEKHKREPRYRHAAATALWVEADALTRMGRIAKARAAVTLAAQIAANYVKPTKLDGDLALTRARIAESSGDFTDALKNYQRADAIFARLAIARSQSLALLGLGDLYEKARDFDREIRYYREAAQVYSGDPAITLATAHNLGYAYEQMGRYDLAIPRFEQALNIAASLRSALLQAHILNNLAVSYARLQQLPEAERAADRALALLSKTDVSGDDARFSRGAKAEVEYKRGDLRAAAADLQQAFRGVDLKTTAPALRDVHEIAYHVYLANGDLPLAMAHLEAFKRLDDQGRALAASANLALVGAQFDFARQDLEIAHLRSAELERGIKLRESREQMQAIVFASIVLAAILLLAWIAWRHTVLKRHRNAIAQKNTELVKTLTERDGEIERRIEVESRLRFAMQAAQQASRAKSQFLANMSHELRTPLNVIIGFSELILGGRMNPEKTPEYAGDIAQGARHLLAVLNNVLDMARIDSGKVELEDRVIRIGTVIDHALTVLGGRNAHPGKEIRTSGDIDILVRADEVRLRQVVINLVSNAVKFTGEGGLIEIRVEPTGDGVDLVVQDNGAGIPADKLPVIMEPFGQAESSYARSYGGVGLGLPIVKSLMELHGGRFTVESEYGRGTIARLHLPQERVVDSGSESTVALAGRAA
jgi:signal transduction histidine kinase/tetratricopeptide (TPR) repeat protein